MLGKTSKILLGVYAFLLLAILLTFSDDFGSFLLLGTGLFTLITSIFVVNDLKKLKNSLASRILSVVLIILILYSTIMLFYGLGNIGVGDKGLLFAFISLSYLIFSGLSIIIGVILVIINKNQNVQNNPNKILSIILLAVLILLFYSTAVSRMARLTNSPGFCTMHIEIKENSFIFREGSKDSCILRVALDTSNVAYCKQIKDTTCILLIARDLGDVNICYQIINDNEKQGRCIENIAKKSGDVSLCEAIGVTDKDSCYYGIARESNNGNPELCNYIKDNEARYYCYSIIAIDKRDPGICEKYFPSNEVLTQEGVDIGHYSKNECIVDATKGAFN